MSSSQFVKWAWLAVIAGLLWLGLLQIQQVVSDRASRRAQVEASMGSRQALSGLAVQVHCTLRWDEEVRTGDTVKTQTRTRELLLAQPAQVLDLQGDVQVERRARGVHHVNAYNLRSRVTARWMQFDALTPPALQAGQRLTCQEPVLNLAVSDPEGIRSLRLLIDGRTQTFRDLRHSDAHARDLQAPLGARLPAPGTPLVAEIEMDLAGIESFQVQPMAESASVRLKGNWSHPSFSGASLPTAREIGPAGFDAHWQLTSLTGRDVGQPRPCEDDSDDGRPTRCGRGVSVGFVEPVNPYTLVDRATKYGLLFVVLTFGLVGLLEVTQRLRVHPVQYLLTGSALSIFFLLLLSLGEHLAFGTAYAIAAAACVLLLGYYAIHMLGGLRRGLPFAGAVGLLYGLLYVLLQLEQTALVVGSTALFLMLATVMVMTRRLDWYAMMPAAQPAQAHGTGAASGSTLQTRSTPAV